MRVTLNSTIRQTMITDTNDDEIAKSIHGNPKPCSSKDLKENSKDFKFEFEKIAVEETQKALQSLVEGSTFFSENPEQDLPVFRHEGEQIEMESFFKW